MDERDVEDIDLLDLEDLIEDLDHEGPTPEQLHELYGVYLRDIVKTPLKFKLQNVKVNNQPSSHPICRGKHQTFEHIITRESKHSGKRNFDVERANKIHWIKPILENSHDPRILYFESIHPQLRCNQFFYWYKSKGFIIILREIKIGVILITSFSVDRLDSTKYIKMHNAYEEAKKNPTS